MRPPATLDYEPPTPPEREPWNAGDYALAFALSAFLMTTWSFAAARSNDNLGWFTAAPCICVNGIAAPLASCVALWLAIVGLREHRASRIKCRVSIALAVVTGPVAIFLLARTVEIFLSV